MKPESQESQEEKAFKENIEEAKTDFNKAVDIYKNYVGKAKSPKKRLARIHTFRCGGL